MPRFKITENADVTPPTIDQRTPSGRRIHVSPLNVSRRLPQLEEFTRAKDGVDVRVWDFVHESEPGDPPLAGLAVMNDGGRHHVFIAGHRAPCPLLRLHTLSHEIRHIQRGDLVARGYSESEDQAAEADCNAAADEAVRTYVAVASQRIQHRVNAELCVTCAHGPRQPCNQGPITFEGIQRALSLL